MTNDVKPTRSELLRIRKQIGLAQRGHGLLKKKRDGLILEFFSVLKKARTLRSELVEEYRKAQACMNIARVAESDLKIRSLAMAASSQAELNVTTKNIMGVVVPKIDSESIQKPFRERNYGLVSGSSKIDEAVDAYEKVIDKVVEAAEIETGLKRILLEIEKTKRRVNALEFEVIPRLQEQSKFVTLRLEEIERENIFRLKRIKASSK